MQISRGLQGRFSRQGSISSILAPRCATATVEDCQDQLIIQANPVRRNHLQPCCCLCPQKPLQPCCCLCSLAQGKAYTALTQKSAPQHPKSFRVGGTHSTGQFRQYTVTYHQNEDPGMSMVAPQASSLKLQSPHKSKGAAT